MSFDKYLWRFGGLSTVALIMLGAKYGHTGRLDQDSTSLFNKAQFYHLLTNFGLIALSFKNSTARWPAKKLAAGGLVCGTLLFCIPLYTMAINGRREDMKYLMPVGGLSFIAGWLAMAFS